MRLFRKSPVSLFVWLLCGFNLTTACAPEEKKAPENHNTLIQQVDGFQVSFDVTTMAKHHALMKSMAMEMPEHGTNMSSHYVMVTLLDEQKKPVADVPLKLKVIAPDGKALIDAAGVTAETMRGEGMFHYGHGFDLSTPGRYQMLVMFIQGGTSHQAGVYWSPSE